MGCGHVTMEYGNIKVTKWWLENVLATVWIIRGSYYTC